MDIDQYNNLVKLKAHVVEIFGEDGAEKWLNTPNVNLIGEVTPIEASKTEQGMKEIKYILWRTQHGIFS